VAGKYRASCFSSTRSAPPTSMRADGSFSSRRWLASPPRVVEGIQQLKPIKISVKLFFVVVMDRYFTTLNLLSTLCHVYGTLTLGTVNETRISGAFTKLSNAAKDKLKRGKHLMERVFLDEHGDLMLGVPWKDRLSGDPRPPPADENGSSRRSVAVTSNSAVRQVATPRPGCAASFAAVAMS
jgi:hypothetical protein